MTIQKSLAQKKLSIAWFIAATGIGGLLLLMSINNKFEDQQSIAWRWYSQLMVPTLLLMVATLIASLQDAANADKTIDKFFFQLCMAVSLIYFAGLAMVLLYTPFAPSALRLMTSSLDFLPIFQGIVTACLGLFFVRRD